MDSGIGALLEAVAEALPASPFDQGAGWWPVLAWLVLVSGFVAFSFWFFLH